MACSLAYQFKRQTNGESERAKHKELVGKLAHEVVNFVCDVMQPEHPRTAIDNFLVTSEFFAREARAFKLKAQTAQPQLEGANA